MMFIRLLCLFCLFFIDINASSHWMVTENGLIEPRVESPFQMTRPYDLLAFLNQDSRWDNIIGVYKDLKIRKDIIQRLMNDIDQDTNIGAHLSVDNNCLNAGSLNDINWYSSIMEDGKYRNIPPEYFVIKEPKIGEDVDLPDCKKISSLTFSMHTFEHLEGMVQRQNLTSGPELQLPEQISPIMNVEQYGHWIAGVLKKNSSSWLHYNMASLYWRVQGNAPKAMECSRRAVHYAPREYKDIALLSMGTIFHHCKVTEDAIIVLSAAYDHNPKYLVNNFVLANAYAVNGDYNSSVKHYNKCHKLDPNFQLAKKHKYGILCHKSILDKMLLVQMMLTKLKQELHEFNEKEENWFKSVAAFLKTMDHNEKYDYTTIEKNCDKMEQLTGFHMHEMRMEGDKYSFIEHILEGPLYNEQWFKERGVRVLDVAYDLQRFIQHIETKILVVNNYINGRILRTIDNKLKIDLPSDTVDLNIGTPLNVVKESSRRVEKNKINNSHNYDSNEYEVGQPLYPVNLNVARNIEQFDTDATWPTKKFCRDESIRFPTDLTKIYPVFLPFENKGIRLRTAFSDKIGVPLDKEHDLPWHPPTCSKDSNVKKSQKSQTLTHEVATAFYLKNKLIAYIGNGNIDAVENMQEAEIGHRIYAAMKMKVAPKWIIYTVASLYWRVRLNNAHALKCLTLAKNNVPMRHRDLVLTSLASVYLELGHFDEALTAAEESFHLSLHEPATNFLLAQMNMMKRHRNTQMYHLKQVIRVEPSFMGGFARLLLNAWSCAIKANEEDIDNLNASDDACESDPHVNMFCDKDGNNCRLTGLHCFNANNRFNIYHSIKPNSNDKQKRNIEPTEHIDIRTLLKDSERNLHALDDIAFSQLLEQMSIGVEDFSHRKTYELMRKSLDALLKDCGPEGCIDFGAEDINFKVEECTLNNIHLGHWLNLLNFKELTIEVNMRLPKEVVNMEIPSKVKIPDCKQSLNLPDDFFMEKIEAIDSEGWTQLPKLLNQVGSVFDYFDYVSLGSKMGYYVENRPRDWMGLFLAALWCGASGHGACCVRCAKAAFALAPAEHSRSVLLALAGIAHLQSKLEDAKEIAYIMFYLSPKSKLEAFLVAVSHTHLAEYEQAVWMYRYALTFDNNFLSAKAWLHGTMCLILHGDRSKLYTKSKN